jgi:hypothetical protein
LLDQPRTGFDVEGVLGDFPRDSQHFCRAPHKHVPIVLKEVDELAFLFAVQIGLDLYGFGWVPVIDLHGLGVLIRLENAACRGHHQAEWHCGQLEAKLP